MDFLSSFQYDDKENIPPFSPKHPNPRPVTSLFSTGTKKSRRPLDDISHRIHPSAISIPLPISISGSDSVPIHICKTNRHSIPRSGFHFASVDLDLACSVLHQANPRKRKVDAGESTQRSCRVSLRKEFR